MLIFFHTKELCLVATSSAYLCTKETDLRGAERNKQRKGFCVSMKFMVSLCPTVNSRKHFWLEIFCSVKLSFRHTLHVFLPWSFVGSLQRVSTSQQSIKFRKGSFFFVGIQGRKKQTGYITVI